MQHTGVNLTQIFLSHFTNFSERSKEKQRKGKKKLSMILMMSHFEAFSRSETNAH